MESLKATQFERIADLITQFNLPSEVYHDELIDHYACLVEEKMEEGKTFTEALELVFNKVEKDQLFTYEVLEQKKYLCSIKKRPMYHSWNLLAACLLGLLVFSFYYEFSQSPSPNELAMELVENAPKNSVGTAVLIHQLAPPSRSPLAESHVTSKFGFRIHPVFQNKKMHKGIDLKAAIGTPVYATADGVVEKVITHNKYGKLIVLRHDTTYQSLYAQLSRFHIKTGDAVKKGDLIAETGNSGLSTAPHLHYEVLKNGKAVNPEAYFN